MNTKKKSPTVRILEKALGKPLTFGVRMNALRKAEGATMDEFAAKLGISKQHLNDIEKGKKAVSPERAARFAGVLGFAEDRFIQLVLQDQLYQAGLIYKVHVSA